MLKGPIVQKEVLAGSTALKVCASVAKSGALAQSICALDNSKIGTKFSFVYDKPFKKGETGIIIATSRGWIALSMQEEILGVSTNWSGTDLFLNEEFIDQFKDVIMVGLPSITMAKLMDLSTEDAPKAIRIWKSIAIAVHEGITAFTEIE
jgi:hypothetical protein